MKDKSTQFHTLSRFLNTVFSIFSFFFLPPSFKTMINILFLLPLYSKAVERERPLGAGAINTAGNPRGASHVTALLPVKGLARRGVLFLRVYVECSPDTPVFSETQRVYRNLHKRTAGRPSLKPRLTHAWWLSSSCPTAQLTLLYVLKK